MKNVLIVSYYYPNRPGVGSNRIGGLCKYLPGFGWNPIVVTPQFHNCQPAPYATVIETEFSSRIDSLKSLFGFKPQVGFHEQVNAKKHGNSHFIRLIVKRVKEVIAYPDEFNTWISLAVDSAMHVIQDMNIDAIISSSSPVSSHIIAHKINKKTKIPWVADLRDLWTQNHYNEYSFARNYFEKQLELRTLSTASALTTVSGAWVEQLKLLHKKENVYQITNGFDPEEVYEEGKQSNKFVIIHAGLLYDQKRDPTMLLEVVSELIFKGVIEKNRFTIDFYGPPNQNLQRTIDRLGLTGVVIQNGVADRKVILEKQREATVQLLLKWDNPLDDPVYPAKIFEYLAARRPILSLGGSGGVIKELLESTQAGVHVLSKDDLRKTLTCWYQLFCKEGELPYTSNRQEVEKYSQIKMAEKFAKVLLS